MNISNLLLKKQKVLNEIFDVHYLLSWAFEKDSNFFAQIPTCF